MRTEIIRAAFCSGRDDTTAYGLHQWDYGQKLEIHGLDLPPAVEIHFAASGDTEALVRIGFTVDKVTTAAIPDTLLEQEKDIRAYVYVSDAEHGETVKTINLPMTRRPRPEAWTGSEETTAGVVIDAVRQFAEGKADSLHYKDNILRLLSGKTELARVTITGGSGSGADAREIELQKSDTAIQWRYAGETQWRDLVLLEDMKGAKGDTGPSPTEEELAQAIGSYLKENPVQGGTTDYAEIENKPSINGVELNGNKTGEELDISPSDEQVSNAVSDWMDEHPEAITTVADGSVTVDKLNDELRKKLGLPASHKLTEVEIPILQVTYSSLYDGTNSGSGTGCSTDLFLTPQYIRIENDTGSAIKAFKIRYADSGDVTSANLIEEWSGKGDSHGTGIHIGGNRGTMEGIKETFQTYEWGSTKRKYMQIAFQCDTWNNSWLKTRVYAIYDSYVPEYEPISKDDSNEYLQDLERRYFIGSRGNNATNKVMCAVPYYPSTRYYVRGGYYANVLSKGVNVYGLYDDTALNNYCDSLGGSSNEYAHNANAVSAPIFVFVQSTTTQFDTTVNGGADSNYQWAYFDTPGEDELRGLKWIAFEMALGDAQPSDSTSETRKAVLDNYLEKGNILTYVSRWEDKNLPRTPGTRLAKANPNAGDMGTRYMAFMSDHSRNPLVNSKWVLFGDSLTDNYGGHDTTEDYFASKIAREFNIDFDNRAKSGSNIYAGGSGNYTSVSGIIMLDTFLEEIDTGTTDIPDYITVAFGTNSFKAQLGTNADTSATNTSVYGATKYFIEKLREKCPNARLAFILSPKQNWGVNDPQGSRDIDGAREAIRTVCKECCVKYKDLSKVLDLTNPVYSGDGIHPNKIPGQVVHYHEMRELMMTL